MKEKMYEIIYTDSMWSYSPRPILNPLVLNINKQLDPWMKSCENQDSILKSRDITLLTKVHIVKAMVFPLKN